MKDLIARLRESYLSHGLNHVQAAADALEQQAKRIEELERELGKAERLAERSTRRLVELSSPGSIGAFAARDHAVERAEKAEKRIEELERRCGVAGQNWASALKMVAEREARVKELERRNVELRSANGFKELEESRNDWREKAWQGAALHNREMQRAERAESALRECMELSDAMAEEADGIVDAWCGFATLKTIKAYREWRAKQ